MHENWSDVLGIRVIELRWIRKVRNLMNQLAHVPTSQLYHFCNYIPVAMGQHVLHLLVLIASQKHLKILPKWGESITNPSWQFNRRNMLSEQFLILKRGVVQVSVNNAIFHLSPFGCVNWVPPKQVEGSWKKEKHNPWLSGSQFDPGFSGTRYPGYPTKNMCWHIEIKQSWGTGTMGF